MRVMAKIVVALSMPLIHFTLLSLFLIGACTGLNSYRAAPLSNNIITQAELVRRTQEMFDAVAGGNKGPVTRNSAEDAIYFDEKGRSMDKLALISNIAPLPQRLRRKDHSDSRN